VAKEARISIKVAEHYTVPTVRGYSGETLILRKQGPYNANVLSAQVNTVLNEPVLERIAQRQRLDAWLAFI
jgi:hypothetical protein